MPFYPAPEIRRTTHGRRRCGYVSQGEQCTRELRGHPIGGHVFRRDILAAQHADRRARMAAIAAEGGERGAFFADLLAADTARKDGTR